MYSLLYRSKHQRSAHRPAGAGYKEYVASEGIDVTETFIDKASGKDFNREEYLNMKGKVRSGGLIIIKELDRLGRNMYMIIPLLTNSKVKSKNHTGAVCQNCGHRWKV